MLSLAFGILAILSIVSALAVVFNTRTFHSAVWLMVFMLTIAGHFLLLGSELVAILQVIVYAGAVVVLFIFVIQLLNLDPTETPLKIHAGRRAQAQWIAAAFVVLTTVLVVAKGGGAGVAKGSAMLDFTHMRELCTAFLSHYVLVFELTSVLLLAAIVGAMILAQKKYLNR